MHRSAFVLLPGLLLLSGCVLIENPPAGAWEDPELTREFEKLNAELFDGGVKGEVRYFPPWMLPHSVFDGLAYYDPPTVFLRWPAGPARKSLLIHEMCHLARPPRWDPAARRWEPPHGERFQQLRERVSAKGGVWVSPF